MDELKRVYRHPRGYTLQVQGQGSLPADWAVGLKRALARLAALGKAAREQTGYGSDLSLMFGEIWQDFDGAITATRNTLREMGVETRNREWKKRQTNQGDDMLTMTEKEMLGVLKEVYSPENIEKTTRLCCSCADDAALKRMMTGPDENQRPANCSSRNTARYAAEELGMRAAGLRVRLVHVPPEVKNARGMVELLRSATARGKAILPEGLPQERRAS